MIRIRVWAIMLGLLCVGGLEGATAAGKVSDGVYFSPLNNFTIPVPNWRQLKIQDRNDDDFAIVSFLDRGDFPASLQSIATLRLTADVELMLLDPSKRDAVIQGFLTGFVVPHLFQNVSPQTAIVHGELFDEGERRFYFAVANIPEGHTFLRNPKKGKQEDSVSGLLIFHNKGFMYMVRVEMKTLLNVGLDPSSLSPKDLKSAQQSLLRIMGTMKFAN
jgi:hypothetical protein